MIAYVDEQNHTGLAIALENAYFIENSYYNSSFQWDDAAAAVTKWAANNAVTGCTWKVPTIQEWQQMLIGCGAEGTVSDEPESGVLTFTGINEKLNAVSQYAKLSSWYWSATESSEVAKSIDFSDTYAGFYSEAKTNYNSVRACLTFDTSGGESGTTNTYVSTFEQPVDYNNPNNLASKEGNNWSLTLQSNTFLERITYEDEYCIVFHTPSEYLNGTVLTPTFQISGEISTITIKAAAGISSIKLNENGNNNDGEFTKIEGTPFDEYTLTPASGVSLNSITIVGQGDFDLKSITIETTTSGGDSGNVITSNTGSINMPKEGTDEYTIAEGVASFNIYDDGGANGNYSNTCEGTIILTAPEGCLLRLTGSVKTVYDSDCLDIWDGTSTNDYHIAGFSGESDEILPIISSGESLRLSFSSDQDDNAEGFALTVEVLTPTTIDNTTESINMPTNGLQKYVISQGVTSFNVYDNGGSDAPYSNNSDGTIILTAPEGCYLKLTGSVVTEDNYDYFKVWDGSNSIGQAKVTLSGNNPEIEPITSTGRSLTLNFYSDGSVNNAGLDLTVTVIDPSAVSTFSVTINNGTGGYVGIYSSEQEFEEDDNVELYISPSTGYVLSNLSVVDADDNPVSVSGNYWYSHSASFQMPASAVTVTPTFSNDLTNLSIDMPYDSYAYIPEGMQSFKLYDDGGHKGNYSEGNRSIVLCAPENYLLQLTGTITALNYEKLTVKDGDSYSNTRLFYAGSSSDGVTTDIGTIKSTGRYMRIEFQTYGSKYPGLDLTVTLVSNAAEYDVTISPASGGTVVAKVNNTQVTKAKVNDVVTLTATPAAGYVLSGISVVDGNSNAVSVTGGTWYNNTATFSMPTSVATVTPVFTNTLTGLSINMPTEGTVTATIPEGVSSFKVYDDGGENGAYSSNCNGNLVLTAPEGNMLQLTGTVTTNADAYITVWNGSDPSNDEAKLINHKSSSTTNNATSIGSPTSTNRSMTLNFTSGFSVFAGLDLTVTQINVCLADAAENSTVIGNNNNRTGRNVLLADRTLYKDGEWNTICLPFNVSLSDSPLDGATAKTLTSATMTGTTVSLTFGDAVTTLQAGVPYIIKWAKAEGYDQADPATRDIVNPLFTGVTVVSSTEAQRTIEKADGHVKFIGYYDPMTIDTPDNDDIYYMTAGNTLKHTGKQRTLKACRAYFQFSEAAQQARSFMLNFGDETTGIAEIRKVSDNSWYTLDGVKLDKQPSKKGLYISNGRKIVIK